MKLRLALACAGAAALVAAAPAAAFTPANSYYPKQWYLAQDHAFDAWSAPPTLAPVKVAVIDSGIDCTLPDFEGRIGATQSFVGGSPCTDSAGHGTIVAGEIAADLGSSGVVGVAYSAELLVAKVVAADGTIPLNAEAKAIRWAANEGARVINLSFGAVRDPADPSVDTYSPIEARAVAYAVRKGALVVAAAGNSDAAPATPWNYASWPAALPHVLGVGALSKSGNVPDFSDRDPTFVDIAAPGIDIFSTYPAALAVPGCQQPGYTDCAVGDLAHPEGTSFAAPQVSAAAAVLFGLQPTLTSSQVETILERSADDVNSTNGCAQCSVGRDRYSGWGRLDLANAVAAVSSGAIPAPDRFEPNDTPGQAPTLNAHDQVVAASLDYWDDPVDYYRVRIRRGAELVAVVHATWPGARVHLLLVSGTGLIRRGFDTSAGSTQRFAFRSTKSAWYYVELRDTHRGGGAYTLQLHKSTPR